MKKRINTIDGKILVQGGTDNELKSNEIRVNADKTLTERVDGKIVSAGGGSGSDGAKIVPLTNQCKVYYDTESVSGWRELSLNSDSTIPNLGVTMLKIESLNVYLTDILTDYFTVNGTITIMDGCLILRDMATVFDGVKLQLIEV